MFKSLKYFIFITFFSFSSSFASQEYQEDYKSPYTPRTLKLKRPPNFLNLTSEQVASMFFDKENDSSTVIHDHGKYRLSKSPEDEDAFKQFLLQTISPDIAIFQRKEEKKSNSNIVDLEIYQWDTEKQLGTNHFYFTICKVSSQKVKKKSK